MRKIQVTISGEDINIHTSGYEGDKCITDLDAFEKELGEIRSRERTAEAFNSPSHEYENVLRH